MPVTPWEAGISVEAWRSAHGQPPYGDIDRDAIAGHMYGPLATRLLGAVVSVAGFSTPATRVPSLVASALLTVLLCKIGRVRGGVGWLCGVALVWGMDYRVSNIFAENRPDAIAFLLAVAGLWGLAAGYGAGRVWPYVAGLFAVLAGFLFKQTAAVAAPIFLVALLIDVRRPWPRRLVLGVIPIAAVAALILGIKYSAPEAYRAILWVPAQYRVDRREFAKLGWHLLYTQPLLWLALLEYLLRGQPRPPFSSRSRLIAAALVVTFPTSVMAASKVGGGDNSLLALLPGLHRLLPGATPRPPELLGWLVPRLATPGRRDGGRGPHDPQLLPQPGPLQPVLPPEHGARAGLSRGGGMAGNTRGGRPQPGGSDHPDRGSRPGLPERLPGAGRPPRRRQLARADPPGRPRRTQGCPGRRQRRVVRDRERRPDPRAGPGRAGLHQGRVESVLLAVDPGEARGRPSAAAGRGAR